MSCIHDLVRNQDTYRADVEQTVLAVAQAMVERNIGAVPVLRDGFLAGIFSERDLMRRVVVEGRADQSRRSDDQQSAYRSAQCRSRDLQISHAPPRLPSPAGL